jgi:hypothetical protein
LLQQKLIIVCRPSQAVAMALNNVQTRGRALAAGVPTMVFYSGFPDVFNSFNQITPHFESTSPSLISSVLWVLHPGFARTRVRVRVGVRTRN